ncbi:MAG: ABC transporter permease [Eubacteriales bacterium]|nr:ABC transporter permease [Eubacteriales bacterium]
MDTTSAPMAPKTVAGKKSRIRVFKKYNPYMIFGASLLILITLVVLIGPLVLQTDPNAINPKMRLQHVGTPGHLLGTDHLGRDMLARILYGGRMSLLTAVLTAFCAAIAGVSVGLVAGMSNKTVDIIIMRVVDMLQSFPNILLAILIVAFLGPSLVNAMIAIAVVNIPFFAILTRSVTLSMKEKDFVKASHAIGNSKLVTTLRHVIPNISPYIISQSMMNVGTMLTVLTSLSFLGLGVQPPTAELGSMLGELRTVMTKIPDVVACPGIVIVLAVIGFNMLGDGLRDHFEPKSRN